MRWLEAATAFTAMAFTIIPSATAQLSGHTYTVKLATDLPDGDLDDGVCSTVEHTPQNPQPPDPDTCTLRAAIQNANRDPTMDTVEFAFGTPTTITLEAYLPILQNSLKIDGWAQSLPSPRSLSDISLTHLCAADDSCSYVVMSKEAT